MAHLLGDRLVKTGIPPISDRAAGAVDSIVDQAQAALMDGADPVTASRDVELLIGLLRARIRRLAALEPALRVQARAELEAELAGGDGLPCRPRHLIEADLAELDAADPDHLEHLWGLGVELAKCPGVTEYGHGLTLTTVHGGGCCERAAVDA